MAWLFLDTHAHGEIRFGWLFGNGKTRVRHRVAKADRLLPALASLLHIGRSTFRAPQAVFLRLPHSFDGICVVAGPGSFSSVRSGVLDANLLARLLHLPLVGVSVAESASVPTLAKRLANGEFRSVRYVAPVYDAEPNITVKTC